MPTFLALDPGTYRMGIALFRDARLVAYWLLEVARGVEIEDRIPALLAQLEALLEGNGDIRAVACEKIGGDVRQMAPELQTLIRRLRRWATNGGKSGHRFAWNVYHPSTVVASVRPRGMKGRSTKEIARAGVKMLYGAGFGDLDQNVIDAIAVGHCHISKTVEAEVLKR